MDTESNQSSEERYQDASQEEDRQRTGLYRWQEPQNLMPPWSVPPGLLVPGPRQPEADAAPQPADRQPVDPGRVDPGPAHAPEPPSGLADDDSWPGVALPADWFLRAQPRPPAARAPSDAVTPDREDEDGA